MRVFIYKRTHKGDPREEGWFGIEDCMGSRRKSRFDAVIGVGGIGAMARADGISGKVNWIGIGAQKIDFRERARGPLIVFDNFVLWEEKGEDFRPLAPALAKRLYSQKATRSVFSDRISEEEREEVRRLLKLAENAPPSAGPPYPTEPLLEKDHYLRCHCF